LILSKADRQLLVLLAQFALESQGWESNLSPEAIALSPGEAEHLLELLEQFATSKLFFEGSYFAEALANGEADTNERLREIYFSWVVRRGGTRVASSQKWREFVLRAGFNSSSEAWMWPRDLRRNPLRPMSLEHFLKMERRLLSTADIHPRVAGLVIDFVERALPALDNFRDWRVKVRPGVLRASVDHFLLQLRHHLRGREREPMSRPRVIAIMTIVMDTAALFATRDWTAAGVLSSLAAVAPDALESAPPP
jgi:hypothetical protein